MLDYRQYALKMIANVTYGYTSASFSGRMPCVEIAGTRVCSQMRMECKGNLGDLFVVDGGVAQIQLCRRDVRRSSARFA